MEWNDKIRAILLLWAKIGANIVKLWQEPPATVPPEAPKLPVEPPKPIEPVPTHEIPMKYDWSNPEAVRHSIRLICDEMGFIGLICHRHGIPLKDCMSRTIHCESGYNIHARHPNLYNGKVVSCDYGLCQWNDHYHGREITPHEAEWDPEKAVRLMGDYFKRGQADQWVCHSTDMCKHYSA